ncbi:MAG TPA: PQQ-binding-like beta-propeller repeat protein, partial [Planctomycetota bacterium]|nr:PQQ-binding-like beta-propeller repeat protein [Planctomycetota bacterium]
SAPGVHPKDNSFSLPVFANLGPREVFYCGTGCGNVVCVDANTGDPIWRYPLSVAGVNASVLLYGGDKLIAVHGKENLDSSDSGRLLMLGRSQTPVASKEGAPLLEKSAEVWRSGDATCYSSSPVLVGDRIYLTTETGEIAAVDATNGKTLWKEKLGIEQLHASALYADGKLYVPIKDGVFAIVKPTDAKPEILCKVELPGEELNGAPSAANGRVYLFSTKKLYCIGTVKPGKPDAYTKPAPGTGPAVKLMPIPGEVLLRPGEKVVIGLAALNAASLPVPLPEGVPSWTTFVPPTAKVKATMGAEFPDPSTISALPAPKPSAGMFEVTVGDAKGYLRGRVLPNLPLKADFDAVDLTVDHETETGVKFAYPPLPWIGARFKWEVRDLDGNKVLTKTIDNKIFQRAMTFIGTPDMKDYTIEADVQSDGNKRKMSEVGIINQRYAVVLKGNAQELEVNSNFERIRVAVPFPWKPKEWYHLKARVDVAADGSGTVRAKAWKKGDPEPEKWTIEVPHTHAHLNGSPG